MSAFQQMAISVKTHIGAADVMSELKRPSRREDMSAFQQVAISVKTHIGAADVMSELKRPLKGVKI